MLKCKCLATWATLALIAEQFLLVPLSPDGVRVGDIARRSHATFTATFTATLKSFKSRVSQLVMRGRSNSNQQSDSAVIAQHRIVNQRIDDE